MNQSIRAKRCKVVNTRNRMISKNIQMTLNTKQTDLNNNILVVGGSGAGKTFRFVKPQIMQMASSFIITDPKGEIMRDTAGFLKKHGYVVRVINLLNAKGVRKSNHYNPFRYIKTDIDVQKLVTNLIRNTTPEGSTSQDPFWEKAETMFLQSLFYYVHYHCAAEEQNFGKIMELINKAEFNEDPRTGAKEDSELDRIFMKLENQLGEEAAGQDMALVSYKKVMRGAADTVRSILISANARLQCLQSKEVLEFFEDDEMDIEMIGERKTVVYCIIPDTDKTFNFVVGMFYTQCFQSLYNSADFVHGGSLPVHVTFLMDEFANVALPDDFCSLLSTMRSREISSIIIIQNIAQIKKLFDKTWETIPGNCDTFVYLGGNEADTQKYVSEQLGKATIDKRTNGQTLGAHGSSNRNFDTLGRELMTPDEVRKLNKKKCIILIRGFDPILDMKINSLKHPMWRELCRTSRDFVYDPRLERIKKKKRNQSAAMILGREQTERIRKTYEEELREYKIEREIDDNAEKPRQPIYFLSYQQIMDIEDSEDLLEKAKDAFKPVFPGAEEIHANLEREKNASEENKRMEKEIYLEEHKEEIESEKQKEITSALQGKEEVTLYGTLYKSGYDTDTIQIIIEFFREMKGELTKEELCATLSPEMSREVVEQLLQAIR